MKRKWILYALLASFLAGAALLASQSQEEPEEFEPSEIVPADTSVSFPVDI
jgi:hypothetical protein